MDLPLASRGFLRNQDFGTPFDWRRLSEFETIAEGWVGADFEFHDSAIQKEFIDLQKSIRVFLELATQFTYPSSNPYIATPMTDLDQQRGISPETLSRIAEMNQSAAHVMVNLDKFIRASRERILTAR